MIARIYADSIIAGSSNLGSDQAIAADLRKKLASVTLTDKHKAAAQAIIDSTIDALETSIENIEAGLAALTEVPEIWTQRLEELTAARDAAFGSIDD